MTQRATTSSTRTSSTSTISVQARVGGVVLVELGIDDHDCNLVRLDFSPTRYAEGARDVVRQTISTLEVILAQLEAMAPTPQVHKNERDAFQFGREAERAVGGLREVRSSD